MCVCVCAFASVHSHLVDVSSPCMPLLVHVCRCDCALSIVLVFYLTIHPSLSLSFADFVVLKVHSESHEICSIVSLTVLHVNLSSVLIRPEMEC